MSLFPKQKIESCFSLHIMPDEFNFSQRANSEISLENIKAFGKETLEFLEANHLHADPYKINSAVFYDLFSLFDSYYKKEFSSIKEKDSKFELIQIEQAIHHIYDFSTTQDISSYLKLVEEYCDDPNICHFILLLAKKYESFYEGYLELYGNWINFFIPFLQHLVKIEFGFHRILQMINSNAQKIIKEHLSKLEEVLIRRKIKPNFDQINEKDLHDLPELLRKIADLKQPLIDKDAIRDNQFYYDLGLWCFFYHLLKFEIDHKEYTFLKINILSPLYLEKIKDLTATPAFKHLTVCGLEKVSLSQDYWKELLSDLCLAIKKHSLDSKEFISLFELLDCLLITIRSKKIESPRLLIESNKGQRCIFVELCDIVFCNQELLKTLEPTYIGGFVSYFEYFVWSLLFLLQRMFESLHTTSKEYEILSHIVTESFCCNVESQTLGLFSLSVYYARKTLMAEFSKDQKLKIAKTLNLSEKTIQEIIASKQTVNLNDLKANLKLTTSLLKGNSEIRNNILEDSNNLMQAFEIYLPQISGRETYEYDETEKRKYIGLFLLSTLNFADSKLDEIRPRFLQAFVEFILKKCRLNKWDLLMLQDDLWKVLPTINNGQEIMLNNDIYELLSIFEKELPVAKLKCSALSHSAMIMNDLKVQEKIYEMVITSFDSYEKELSIMWDQMDLSGSESFKENQKIKSINLLIRKIIYFILPWTECVSKALKKNEHEDYAQKILNILKRVNSVFYSPAFFLIADAYERKSYYSCVTSLNQINSDTLLFGALSISQNLTILFTPLIKDICSDQTKKEKWRALFNLIKADDSLPILYEQERELRSLSKSLISLYIAIKYLMRIPILLDQKTLLELNEEEFIESLNLASKVLNEFLFHTFCLMDPVDLQDVNNDMELNTNNGIINRILSSITCLQKQFSSFEKTIQAIANSLCDLVCKCSKLSGTASLGYVLNYLSHLISALGNPFDKKTIGVLFCYPEIFQLFIKELALIIHQRTKSDQATRKGSQIMMNNLNQIKCVLNLVQPKFKTKENFDEIDSALSAGKLGINLNQLMQKMITTITGELKNFPLKQMITLENTSQGEILSRILMILETCYVKLDNHKATEIKDLTTTVNSLQLDLNKLLIKPEEVNETSLSEEDVSKLVIDLKGQIQEKNEAIQTLKNSKSLLINELFLIVKDFNIVYSFDEAKKIDDQKVKSIRKDLVNSIAKFIDDFNRRVTNNTSAKKSFRIDQSKEEITFLEANHTKGKIYNQILTMSAYLKLFQNFITQSASNLDLEHEFFLLLYDSITHLLVEFMKQNPEEVSSSKEDLVIKYHFYGKVTNLIGNVTKILLLYYTNNYVKQKVQEKQSIAISKFVKLIFDFHIYLLKAVDESLFLPESPLLVDLMGLMQIAFYSEQKLKYSCLLEESNFLEVFVQLKTKVPWKISTLRSIIYTLDLFLEDSIPHEMAIERELKQILLGTSESQFKLEDLTSRSSIKEKEKRCKEILVSTLETKFQISSLNSDPKSRNRYAPEYLAYSFDFSQEKQSPANKIQDFIKNLSQNAQKIVELLTYSIIDNYLHNFSKFAEKEISSILTCLSCLANKHRHIAICIAFQKNDYRNLVQKYSSEISFIKDTDIQSFESITFLECLFKIKYFSLNVEDLFIFIKVFVSHTGVTFLHPEDPKTVLDVQHIFINKILQWVKEDLVERFKKQDENNLSSQENFIAVGAATHLLTFLWYCIDQMLPKDIFQKYLKGSILSLLKQILSTSRQTIKQQYHLIKSGNSLENVIITQLNSYYTSQLSIASLTSESIDLFKCENYKDFLEACELDNQIQLQEKLCQIFDKMEFKLTVRHDSVTKEHYTSLKEDAARKEHAIKAITRGNDPENLIQSPLAKSSYISTNGTLWEQMFIKKASYLKSVASFYGKIQNQEDSEEIKTMIYNLANECNRFNLDSSTDFYRMVPKMLVVEGISLLQDHSKPQKKQPVSIKERFYAIISKNLKNKALQGLEEEKQHSQEFISLKKEKALTENLDKKDTNLNGIPNQDNIGGIKNEKFEEENKIKYFFHPTLQDQKEFEILYQNGVLKLKLLSERILVALIHSGLDKQELEPFKQKLVSEEFIQIICSLPEFEKSMLYCLVRLFDILKPFNYPPDYEEIQKEFSWIQNNFELYISILNRLRGTEPPKTAGNTNNKPATNYDPTITFSGDFRFYTDSLPTSAPIHQENALENAKTKFNAKSSLFKDLYLVDEELVESLISYFYLADEKNLIYYAPDTVQMLSGLCNSAQFEVKMIDFCVFFLYCPEHIETMIHSGKQFPYSKILNTDLYHSPAQIYRIVASNIMDFLKYRFSQVDYLVYQPRVFFEQNGLSSIQNMKITTGYLKKTCGMASLADLILGLIEIKEIATNPNLSSEYENLIKNIFSKVRTFEITEIKEGEELIEKARIFSAQSCQRLLRINKIETIFKNFTSLFLYDFKILNKFIENKLEELNGVVEETNSILKNKVSVSNMALNVDDLKAILDKEAVFVGLGDILMAASSLISTWFLDKYQKGKIDEKEKLFEDMLQTFDKKILSENYFEDFMIHLFELANYLSNLETLKQVRLKTLASYIIKVCTYFYALVCIRESYKRTKSSNTAKPIKDPELPSLSSIVSNESIRDQEEFPELTGTFSYLRTSRQFSFDLLFSNMSKKYQEMILNQAYENSAKNTLTKEIFIICTRLPWILDFTSKKKILNEAIQNNLKELNANGFREIFIDRKNLIKTSLCQFSNRSFKELKKKISLKFLNEQGTDAGGPMREYLTIINRELFDPKTGLFWLSENKANIQPSPTSVIIPSHFKYLQLAGITLAKAIQHECVVDVNLSQPFLKHILKRNIGLNDLEEIDSDLAKSLKWMLENSVEGLEQPFTYETEVAGQKITRELIPNGYDITVTDENKKLFVKRVCELKMKQEIQEELEAFLKGFHLMIPADFFALFTPSELQLIIAGVPTIDIEELKKFAQYNSGYTKDSEQMQWMWEILSEFSQKDLASFVFFVSGSLKIPYGGLRDRPLRYRKAEYGPEKLPIAHTWYTFFKEIKLLKNISSWEIEIPPYRSKEELKQKLLLAIFEGRESFMLL